MKLRRFLSVALCALFGSPFIPAAQAQPQGVTDTEIVLGTRNVHPAQAMHKRFRRGTGSRSRAAAGALRLGSTFSAALTARRPLGPAEASMLLYGAIFALVTAGVAIAWPALVAVPLGAFVAWLGMGWLVRAWSLYRGR